MCLIDAIRLFKTSRAGFGIGALPEGGLGVDYICQCETNHALWGFLPVFTLNDDEKKEFQEFYVKFHEWYRRFYSFNYGPEPGSKDKLTKKMLDLYRSAFRNNDIETAFITLSGVWELFAQQFPEEDTRIGTWISERIRQSVSRMIRNGGVVKEKSQDNLYKKIGYLYAQRCIIVHKDKDEPFDEECMMMAFDITRCLILKMFYAEDTDIETIVRKLEYCDKDSAAYKVDSVKWVSVSDDLMEKIFKPNNPIVGQPPRCT